MVINQFFLALFFLYFVLMSGECSEIMNCSLQRYINNNNWIKHVMIFISIYLFTFILNWYSVESLVVVETFNNNKDKDNYLFKSFYYSIGIYLIFILSTKNEGPYLFTFLLVSICIVIGTIITKSIDSEIYYELKNNFIITNKIKKKLLNKYYNNKNEVNKIVLYQNIMTYSFIIIMLILFLGSYKYYLRQSLEHKKWSWIIFWFGYNKNCRNK
jgi:hypothetical protein